MRFKDIFPNKKPLIACVHLLPLPGAPLYDGNISAVYEQALQDVEIYERHGVDALIIENFRDKPFFPGAVPPETIASIAGIAREIKMRTMLPVGINVLRNDAHAALAIATAVGASFIRVNVHGGAIVSEQGILEGSGHLTMRLRQNLKSNVLVFADVGVKHAASLADRGLAIETRDLTERGLVDAIIVSGELTGRATDPEDVDIVKNNTHLPLIIGSGTTPENISQVIDKVDAFIVGSYFKKDGKGNNLVDPLRVAKMTHAYKVMAQAVL